MKSNLRFISNLLLLSFLFQQVSYAAGDSKPEPFNLFQKPQVHFKLPESIASFEDSWLSAGQGQTKNVIARERSERSNLTSNSEDQIASSPLASRNDKLIYLIQDAHTNESGQLNLAKTLDLLLKEEKDLKYIFVEAGTGDDSLSVLRQHATLSDRKRVADTYLKKGILHGEEYLDLTSEKDFKVWGVEDMNLYEKTLEAYKHVFKDREKFELYLKKIEQAVSTLKPRIFNAALLSFDEKQAKFSKEDLSLTDYFQLLTQEAQARQISLEFYPHLKALGKLKEKEESLDFKKANEEQIEAIRSLSAQDQKELLDLSQKEKSPFKLSNNDHKEDKAYYTILEEKLLSNVIARSEATKQSLLSQIASSPSAPRNDTVFPSTPRSDYKELFKYFDYLKEAKQLNPKNILIEQKTLETQLLDTLSKTQDEKNLLKCQQALRHFQKLFNLTLTPEEFNDYQSLTGQDWSLRAPQGRSNLINSTLNQIASSPSAPRNDASGSFTIVHLTGFLNKKIMDLKQYYERASFLEEGFDAMVKNAETFYTLTKDRDEAFLNNMFSKMTQESQTKAVLITGGYHTPNLKSLLKQKNISYISITPQVLHETNQKRYEKLLLNQKIDPGLLQPSETTSTPLSSSRHLSRTIMVVDSPEVLSKIVGEGLQITMPPQTLFPSKGFRPVIGGPTIALQPPAGRARAGA